MRRAFLLLIVLAGVLPAAASAGSYQVPACNDAPEGANNSWIWSTSDPSQPSHYAEHENCPYRLGGSGGASDQEGGLSTTDALHLKNGAPSGTAAGWTVTAPEGTTITEIEYEPYLGHIDDSNNSWSPALRADGSIVPGQTCQDTIQNSWQCFIGGPPGHGLQPTLITGLAAHQLFFGITCQAEPETECITGASEYAAWATMYGAKVTIQDPTPPTLSSPSGTLWGPGPHNGFHQGTETVSVSAHDTGAGVQNLTLSADGQPATTYNATCDFTIPQPCPLSTGPQTLTLPTANLTDGTHTIALAATDAAGNQSTIASDQITVDNNPPPAPIGLTATYTANETFDMTWTAPGGQIAPITQATYQVCPTSGSGICTPATTTPLALPTTVTAPGPGTWNIALWLTDAAGNGTQANAAHTTVNVPALNNDETLPDQTPPNSTGPRPSTKTGTTKPAIHINETLHGRELIVHISGPATGRVRVKFSGRLEHHTITSATRTFTLKHGHLTARFKLGPRTAAHATIRVSAQLDQQPAVTSTLPRRPLNAPLRPSSSARRVPCTLTVGLAGLSGPFRAPGPSCGLGAPLRRGC
jgi:hypothetical protein